MTDNNNNKNYSIPSDEDNNMVSESIAIQYNSIDALKLICMEKIIKLNDSKVLKTIIHSINEMTSKNAKVDLQPYTIEELQTRTDEAYEELEAGGGKDGELFFEELNDYITAR